MRKWKGSNNSKTISTLIAVAAIVSVQFFLHPRPSPPVRINSREETCLESTPEELYNNSQPSLIAIVKNRFLNESSHKAVLTDLNASDQIGDGDDVLPWEPSDQWIQNCLDQQSKNNETYARYRAPWARYQLGTCIRACKACKTSVSAASKVKELSIAGEYWHNVCKTKNFDNGSNLTFLEELFHRYKLNPYPYTEPWSRPKDDELVIHLRIRDVMDEPAYVGANASIMQMLRDGLDTTHGPHDAYYPKGIRSIRDVLSIIQQSKLTKVVLKGGSHKPRVFSNSRIYTYCLANVIRTAGYNLTTLRTSGEDNPDQDFYYMSHSKYFLPSTGGYSRLISLLVEKQGVKLVVDSTCSNADKRTPGRHALATGSLFRTIGGSIRFD